MRVYHERLTAPASWWLAGLAVIGLLGAEVNVLLIAMLPAGLGWLAAAGLYVVVGGLWCAMMFSWGRAQVVVAGGELRAGAHRAPLAEVDEVAVLDRAGTRALRGPRADPAGFLLVRPYLRESVLVRLRGGAGSPPYCLVGTRRPAALAAALEAARTAVRPGGSAVG